MKEAEVFKAFGTLHEALKADPNDPRWDEVCQEKSAPESIQPEPREELDPWEDDTTLPFETIDGIAKMLNALAYSGKCTQKEDGFFSSSSNCLATWVSCLADRITAAQERERRTYERLHECFWDKWTVQCVVRQMRDDADDLRRANPKASEELDAFSDALVKLAKNGSNNDAGIGQLDAYAPDELTKGEKVSTSHEPGDAVTESLADIVRDLRDCANRVEEDCHDEDVWDSSEAAWIYRDIADRIDAAVERGQAHGPSSGNAAAMRLCDELIQAAYDADICSPGDLAQRVRKIKEAIGPSQSGNASALREALEDTEELLEHFAKPGTMLHSAFYLHMRDNRAALAAPARNCDKYETDEEARDAWENQSGARDYFTFAWWCFAVFE
jgi:hypothetical protein